MPDPQTATDADLVSGSALFDRDWYVSRYPDVARSGLDPIEHFLKYAVSRRLSPGPNFDAVTYLSRRPDVARARTNPLVHFLKYYPIELEGADFASVVSNLSGLGISRTFESSSEAIDLVLDEMRALVGTATEPAETKGRRRPVVFVTHDMEVGGAQEVILSVAAWFKRHTAFDVRLVAMAGGPWQERFEAIAPVHVVGHRHVPDDAILDLKEQIRVFLGEEPSFVFVNSVASGDFCRIDPYLAPTFAYLHELKNVLNLFPGQFDQILQRADHIFCGGPAVADTLATIDRVDASKLSMIPAFIQLDEEPPTLEMFDKQRLRAELGFAPGVKMVVGCGTVNWRKQPDVFVRMASTIATPSQFVWIGDGEDLQAMKDLARELGVSDRVHFVGYKQNFRNYLRAADVFALTSSEDPFPLVCLEAAVASTPSVIFREAGGMYLLVAPTDGEPAGVAVPLGDEQAFARAVENLLVRDDVRRGYADMARARTRKQFSAPVACEKILRTVRSVAKLRPKVSVVVPTYNSASFLRRRLDSVYGQSFKDVEILLFDDCSIDESAIILEEYAQSSTLSRLSRAAENSGSVFRAWRRGIEAAEGELIWIAEADDDCDLDFLEKLVDVFDSTSGLRLCFGRSYKINEADEIVGDYGAYLDRVAPGQWQNSFVEPAHSCVDRALGRANVIPNASAVVTRRESAVRAIDFAANFRLAGDWAFYLAAIHGGRIAYVGDAINYHRRHSDTVTHSLEGSLLYFEELFAVGEYVKARYGQSEERDAVFQRILVAEMERFGFFEESLSVPLELLSTERVMPKVLFGVGDLAGGGAQMFAVRFVNAWVRAGGDAVLFSCGKEPDHPAVRRALDPMVPYVSASDISEVGLSAFLADWGLDTIVTGHWWADKTVGGWLDEDRSIKARWAIVMHGCHENVLEHSVSFPAYREDLKRMETRAQLWIWTADKNRRLFQEGHVKPKAQTHIVSGFQPMEPSSISRERLGLPDDAVIFTLASRAIEEKGWYAALEAFLQVRADPEVKSDIRLLLIGDGPAAVEIGERGPIPGVHLVPHTDRLADFIHASDVCLLPSWFAGESMPLVVIEFLAQGKPAIVSDIGMCSWLITDTDTQEKAGFVLHRDGPDGSVKVEDLAAVIRASVLDSDVLERLSGVAVGAFGKFGLKRMVDEYLDELIRLPEWTLSGAGSSVQARYTAGGGQHHSP